MRWWTWSRAVVVALVGVGVGATATLWLQPAASSPSRPRAPGLLSVERVEAPQTFLAWVPGGLPPGFAADVRGLRAVARMTTVAENDVWLARSWSASGELVDDAPVPYRFPLDTAAVDPATFAEFVPPPDRASIAALGEGSAILGSTSASLRGLGPGAELDLGTHARVRVAAVLPDELVGAAELVVSSETGSRLGVVRDRYLLVQPVDGRRFTSATMKKLLAPLLPAEYRLQVRSPGETPYFRAGDSVLPPVLVKALFGEFAARPTPGHPGALEVDPAWEAAYLETAHMPLLGGVTCNRGIMPQLRGAMAELASDGAAGAVKTFHGCFVPRYIGRDPRSMISYHSWGIAFDLNLAGNLHGQLPHQDPRLVATLARWGFAWGGTWLLPDGNHFEYHRAPMPA